MCTTMLKTLVILFVLMLMIVIRKAHCDTSCNCKPLRQCPTFAKFFKSLEKPLKPTTVEFLRSKGCGFQDGFPKICCLRSYSKPHLLRSKPPPKKRCNTQECVMLKNCDPFMRFINATEKPLKPPVIEFLRNQECGFESGYPKVCCGIIPRNLRFFKNSRPKLRQHTSFNILSAQNTSEEDKDTPEVMNIFKEPIIKTSTTQKNNNIDYIRKHKADALNKAFSFIDFIDFSSDGFDFAIRKRREDYMDNLPDLEIR